MSREWMSFFVRGLAPGEVWETRTTEEETAVPTLGGISLADWGEAWWQIGPRKGLFESTLLGGSAGSLANADDPQHAWVRNAWRVHFRR